MVEEPKKLKRPRGKARLIPGKCIACGARCQQKCPFDAITMNDKGEPIIDLEKCTGCQQCVKICPVQALEIVYTPEEQKILDELAKQTTVTESALSGLSNPHGMQSDNYQCFSRFG